MGSWSAQDAVSWISAASSLVLVGVTAWYAHLTNKLSKSARDSATSAERTAALTAEALAASVAALDVGFAVFPNSHGVSGGAISVLGVSVQCTGATVFVRRAHVREVYRLDKAHDDGADYSLITKDVALAPDSGGLNVSPVEMPVRMHKNETIHLESEPAVLMESSERVGSLAVSIWYSLTRDGEQRERHVEYVTTGDD